MNGGDKTNPSRPKSPMMKGFNECEESIKPWRSKVEMKREVWKADFT